MFSSTRLSPTLLSLPPASNIFSFAELITLLPVVTQALRNNVINLIIEYYSSNLDINLKLKSNDVLQQIFK